MEINMYMYVSVLLYLHKEHAHFHVFSPFSASFTPHYIIMVKGILCSLLNSGEQ